MALSDSHSSASLGVKQNVVRVTVLPLRPLRKTFKASTQAGQV